MGAYRAGCSTPQPQPYLGQGKVIRGRDRARGRVGRGFSCPNHTSELSSVVTCQNIYSSRHVACRYGREGELMEGGREG